MLLATCLAAASAAICGVTLWQSRQLRRELRQNASQGAPPRLLADSGLSDLSETALNALDTEVCAIDSVGQIVFANRSWNAYAAAAEFGRSGEVGADFCSLCRHGGHLSEEDGDRLATSVEAILAGSPESFRQEFVCKAPGRRVLSIRVLPLRGEDRGALVLQADRTADAQHEDRLRKAKREAETLADALETSQNSLKFAMRGANLALWHWDVTTGYFELTREWVAELGHTRSDLGADINAFRELLHPDDLVLWTEDDANSIVGDEPYDRQFRLRRADGGYVWAQALGRSDSFGLNGAPECLSGVLIDIDARKTSELRDQGIAKIIEESVNEIYVIDAETCRFLEVNRGARENLGYSQQELRAKTPWDIKPEYDEAGFRRVIEPIVSGRESQVEFETLHERRDGSTYPVMVNLQTARLVGRPVFVAMIVDVTQRNELESRLRQAQKLESIGELAAGVAHEINTPMQYVGNNIRFLSDCVGQLIEVVDACDEASTNDGPNSRPRHKRLEMIRAEVPRAIEECTDGVGRVLEIVRAMKELAHPGDDRRVPTDLNHLLQSLATVTRNRWKYVADLEFELDPALPATPCDAGAIGQVFINLIVNAADAIDEAFADDAERRGRILIRSIGQRDSVVVEVIDDGGGMPDDVKARAFDPFYTTKEVGRGTGQGLSLCHTIVASRHGGDIAIDSRRGEGTTVTVRLPLDQELDEVNAGHDKTQMTEQMA